MSIRSLALRLMRRLAGFALAAGMAAASLAAGAGEIVVREALAVASESDTFPGSAGLHAVMLPDRWTQNEQRAVTSTWYRARFELADLPPHDKLLALYIERACQQVDVYLNGMRISAGGPAAEPWRRDCYRPQYVPLPTATLQAGTNTLDLQVRGLALARVSAVQRAGGLSELRIGDALALQAAVDDGMFWQVRAPMIANVALGVVGLIVLGLWAFQRREAHFMYWGLSAVVWALLSVRLWGRDLPLPSSSVEFLIACSYPVVTALVVQFFLSYADLRSRAIEGALVAQAVVVPLSLLIAGPNQLFAVAGAWYVLYAVEVVAAIALYLRVAWQNKRKDFWPVAALLGAGLVALFIEQAVQAQWLAPRNVSMMHLAMPIVLCGFGFRLVYSHAKALTLAEAARNSLETRIPQITADIERNFSHLADLRVEQVTEKERKRIAADLHDDLGAKLLTIVHTSDNDRISTLAREALEEMRLSVRGLTGKPMQLTDALADWRAEVVSRLGQANIEIDWRGPMEDTDLQLPARSYVQTTRILREAVSNIIKHSGASHCKVRCAVGDTQFGINIQDNGRGIPMELDGKLDRGHGMFSMKQRAKNMQGQCLVESGPGYGTVIRLTLPL